MSPGTAGAATGFGPGAAALPLAPAWAWLAAACRSRPGVRVNRPTRRSQGPPPGRRCRARSWDGGNPIASPSPPAEAGHAAGPGPGRRCHPAAGLRDARRGPAAADPLWGMGTAGIAARHWRSVGGPCPKAHPATLGSPPGRGAAGLALAPGPQQAATGAEAVDPALGQRRTAADAGWRGAQNGVGGRSGAPTMAQHPHSDREEEISASH